MNTRFVLALAFAASVPSSLLYACSNDSSSSGGTPAPTSTTPSPTTTQTSPPPGGDSGGPSDAATDSADGGCTTTTPDLDGGGLCGARPFGSPAAVLTLADAGWQLDGSAAIPPGIYDVASGERAASVPYDWRETLVLDGAKYTQIRRFDTSNGNEGPTNSRSGTYTTAGGEITFAATCAKSADGGDITLGGGTFRYHVDTKGCDVELKMIVAGTLLTFKRR